MGFHINYQMKKIVDLMGKFNIDLLQYNKNNNTSYSLDAVYYSFLLPYISVLAHISTKPWTLIDKVFLSYMKMLFLDGNFIFRLVKTSFLSKAHKMNIIILCLL